MNNSERINGLRILEANWDSYGAIAPSEVAIDNALAVDAMLGAVVKEVSPTVAGGVTFMWEDDVVYTAIECLNDGTVVMTIDLTDHTTWPESFDRLKEFMR